MPKRKGFGDKFKPQTGTWECSCLVINVQSAKTCVACKAPNPNTSQEPAGFGDKFEPQTGTWECSFCLIINVQSAEKCVTCETPNPSPSRELAGLGRGRGEEQGRPSAEGKGQARDVQRAQGVREGEFLATRQQASQPAEVPRQQPQRQVPLTHSGGTAEQFADASCRERIPQQPPKPTAEVPSQVMESMAGLSLKAKPKQSSKKLQMAPRQPKGIIGRPIDLISNYFLLKFRDISIYHYDIEIVFLRQYREEQEAAGGLKARPKKGKSLLSEGRTAKEDAKKCVSHVEHQMKRAPGKQRCRQIITEMCGRDRFRPYNPVYDGQKNMYTTKMLSMDPEQQNIKCRIELREEGSVKEFEVTIKPVKKKGGGNLINLEPLRELYRPGRNNISAEIPQDVIMAFDTVMCHRSPPFSQVQVGRSFFLINDPNEHKFRLGEGLEIWFGYNQSIHLTQKGPAVVVNCSAKVFHEALHVIEAANQILSTDRNQVDITRLPRLNPQQIKTLESNFVKIKVEVVNQRYPRKYPVKGLTRTSANETRFKLDDNTEVSVAQYFQSTYGDPLKYPNLPCLHMRTSKNTTFMPMEVCRIPGGQPKLGKLSGNMTSSMIRKTAIPVQDRFQKIWGNAQLIEQMSGQIMSNFGLFLELKFMELQGRVIGPPRLAYKPGDRGPVTADVDNRGTWKMDGKQFFKSKTEPCSWVLLSFSGDRFCTMRHLQNFADTLCNCARSAGMNLEGPKDIRIFRSHEKTIEALKYAKKCDVTFAIVVLSSRDNYHSYEEVKFVAEIQLRLLTQCMNDLVVVKKCNLQVAGNVLLKINSKLGGVNHTLSQRPVIFSKPMIVFGADATHSPRGYACPSIAAVVGSLDAFPFRYAATCRVQQNPDTKKLSQEIIVELEEMVKEILQAFLRSTRGKNPEKVVFFRDGVSEGQFNIVLENEIAAIQRACIAELNGFLPSLTFIVVQKRHQTRFRPRNPREGVGKPGNVPPGTTVDTDVVHPKYFDFFLCSHEGIQGTSKPAHYTVLYDENKLSSNELQQLCYHLCHMYVRCNRSISVPAPVMYADLACTRAKKYADWYISEHPESVSSGSSDETRMLPEEMVKAISGMKNFESGMFYV